MGGIYRGIGIGIVATRAIGIGIGIGIGMVAARAIGIGIGVGGRRSGSALASDEPWEFDAGDA